MPPLTIRLPGLQQLGPCIQVELGVGSARVAALQVAGHAVPAPVPVTAMIDTGAAATVVGASVAQQLGLSPVGAVLVNTAVVTGVLCYQYQARVLLASGALLAECVVIAAPLRGRRFQCLIGRDLLARATFFYNGPDESFTLTL